MEEKTYTLNNADPITELIGFHLGSGLSQDTEILHFAESSLGLNSVSEIATAINECSDEISGLTDLILFPHDSLALMLESLIPGQGISKERELRILDFLSADISEIPIMLDDTTGICSLAVDREKLGQYIKRLRLKKASPFDLPGEPVQEKITGLLTKARLMIRRAEVHADRNEDCTMLAKKLASGTEDEETFIEAVKIALGILESGKDGLPLFNLLNIEKKKWTDILQKNKIFQEMSSRYSMDILMSQRISPPPESAGCADKNISLIDHIFRVLFEIIPPPIKNGTTRSLEISRLDEDTMAEIISPL